MSKDEYLFEEVYEPADDTYLLLKVAQEEVKSKDNVLELGCGSGMISAKLRPLVHRVFATDVNPHAVQMANKAGIETVRTDLFMGIKSKFDLIIFNPPYLPTEPTDKVEGWLNFAFDGGASGRDTIDLFLEGLKEHLKPDGRALLLVSSLSGLDDVETKAQKVGLKSQVMIREKYFFESLYVIKLNVADKNDMKI